MPRVLVAAAIQAAGVGLATFGTHRLAGPRGVAVLVGILLYQAGNQLAPPDAVGQARGVLGYVA